MRKTTEPAKARRCSGATSPGWLEAEGGADFTRTHDATADSLRLNLEPATRLELRTAAGWQTRRLMNQMIGAVPKRTTQCLFDP